MHETFTKVDYIFVHKPFPNKFQGIRILQNTFYRHNAIELKADNRETRGVSKNKTKTVLRDFYRRTTESLVGQKEMTVEILKQL